MGASDAEATRVESPRGRALDSEGMIAAPSTGASSLLATDALRTERHTQRRIALVVAALLSGFAVVALQFAEERPITHWILTGLLAVTALLSAAAFLLARFRGGTGALNSTVVGVVATLTALAGIAHTGVVSAVACALPLIVYYFAFGDSVARANWLFLLCAIGYGLLVIFAGTGVLPLRDSLVAVAVTRGGARNLGVFATVVEAILIGTFFMARRSRRATLHAMEQLEAARRRIEQRDALLDEARADFDRAMEAGRFGRMTGSRVGPWTADEVIGRGGMGEIYRAVHGETQQPAALKVLHAFMLDEPAHVERFFREAKISSELDSPHIVKVLDSGRAQDGTPYLAMELLEGTDLARHLRENKRLGLRETLELVSQVARALSVAHEAGIVHRDLKPQNLFFSRDTWKVLDFGVSKIAEAGVTLTHGAAVGTPSYMSPEQARGHAVDGRADVFSLGVVAYRALTGRPPFTAPDAVATMYQVMHVQPARPGDFMTEHEDVDLVLALALAKDREKRFGTATAFSAALADAARGLLDVRFREAARALLGREPWGTELPRS